MTTAYLCPGCRLNALRRFRIYRRIGPASRATFVSLYGKKPAALRDESASPPPPIAGVSDDAPRTQWPSDVRTEADIVPDIDVNGNSTDRVLEMMRTLAQNGPLRTRYSRTVLPGPVPASEPAHKSTADHKKANIRYYVARDENHHSGNVTPTRQTSISQLVHAPGPAQKSTVDHPVDNQAETFGFSKSVLQDAMPFAVFVSRILYLTDPRTHFETYIMESMLRSSVEKKQIASFMECMAKGERDSMFVHFTNGANVSLDTEQISLDDLAAIEKFLGDQLELCVLHSSLPSAIALWEQAVAIAQSHTLQKRGMRFSGELYNDFMSAFMKLKRPEQAVLVWNTLNTHGFNPTVKMWTSMLEGFMRLGDVEATEQVWDRMLLSGTKPDSCAWTARLLALFHRSYGEGMQALKHFGETWIEALRKAGNEKDAEQVATRPTTRLLNRLITRFYRKGTRYADVMTDLLVWGKDHGVKPDIVTMNMLLGKSLKLDNSEEASNVFNLMQEQGIKPDPATYAIIIDSIFRDELIAPNFEAQMERVGAVLKEAEEQGLDVAEQTYTAIINGLIKSYGNIDAAKAVLNFMISKGAQPHIYVFTIIATHLFEQDPPDVVGLDLLYTQVRKLHVTKRVQPDVIFYDRMIEGYAKIGQIGKAMTFLAKMSPKHCPGWRALAAVAQALANAGDWSRLDGLLQDVQGEAREKFGEKKFWDKVAQIEASRPSPRPGVAAAQPGMAAAQTG
ncbi:hypothetical protein K490DRAFT_66013 [Saccharata proteae CBS 121410]|uniref:Pentatricopeptide repeat protein n=1 Tax=Saccharata proteae CBS 121410 TaxID=1314787 RepID=A0A9P4HSF5_9PEZI|nr:hypothetical protein K490DRAFT_66013 [Saccharata proteae CBS 121410]